MSSDIQRKLLDFEVRPPEGSWNKILAVLDEEMPDFPQKLYAYEEKPADSVWIEVEARLDEKVEAKVIPFFSRYNKAIRYAGIAAAMIIAISTIYFFNRNDSERGIVQQVKIQQTPGPFIEKTPDENKNPQADLAQTAPEKKPTRDHTAYVPHKTEKQKEISPEPVAILEYLPAPEIDNGMLAYNHPSDKYMIYLDEDGNATRLPKKLFDSFECATKEPACRKKIRDLQDRVASSSVSSDFTGLLEMLRNLRENQ
jgi:hypothetical protein